MLKGKQSPCGEIFDNCVFWKVIWSLHNWYQCDTVSHCLINMDSINLKTKDKKLKEKNEFKSTTYIVSDALWDLYLICGVLKYLICFFFVFCYLVINFIKRKRWKETTHNIHLLYLNTILGSCIQNLTQLKVQNSYQKNGLKVSK